MDVPNSECFEFDVKSLNDREIFKIFTRHCHHEFNSENLFFLSLVYHLSKGDSRWLSSFSTNDAIIMFNTNNIHLLMIQEITRRKLTNDSLISMISNIDTKKDMIDFFQEFHDKGIVDLVKYYTIFNLFIMLFIQEGKLFTINISAHERTSLLHKWTEICNEYEDLLEIMHISETIGNSFETWYNSCLTIFEDVIREIEHLINYDIFPRFKRSHYFLNYIDSLSADQIKTISSPKGLLQIQEYCLDSFDMSNIVITNKEVKLAKVLSQDYYHWKSIHSNNNLNIYTSNISILLPDSISVYGPMNAYKTNYQFDKSALDFVLMFTKGYNYMNISEITKISCLNYHSIENYKVKLGAKTIKQCKNSKNEEPQYKMIMDKNYFPQMDKHKLQTLINKFETKEMDIYPSTIIYSERDTLLIKREFLQTVTLYYDSHTRTYYFIFKNCEYHSENKFIRAITYGFTAIKELGPNKCLYSAVFFVNLKGYLGKLSAPTNFLTKNSMISHISNSLQNMKKLLEKPPELHSDELLLLFPLMEQIMT